MIEDVLITYGPLGMWTAWLLYQGTKREKREEETRSKLTGVIESNTIAVTRFYEVIQKCQKN